ncbi:MAG: flippase-like domain-containing protein [Muribaculaceae bacterium]|nr:flippase-like domain-containing protein [Muribaculaceae bacterium]
MSDTNRQNDPERFRYLRLAWKIFLPVAIGVAVVVWLFHREFDANVWHTIHWNARVIGCIFLAWIFMVGRDFGLSWRFRTLTDRKLRWNQAIRVNMLCEFTSCVTPSAVGGSAFGMLYLHREGIPLGRATTLMMTTLFLDELFFVASLPVMMILIPYKDLFGFAGSVFSTGLQTVFWAIYAVLLAWTALLFTGILVKPKVIHSIINRVFKFKWLKRWAAKADKTGYEMELTSAELRQRNWKWWIKVSGATVLSWCSRYLVVNALFLGFVPAASQCVVFARQFVVWVVLMVSPTPGGSGVSEWLFTTYYGDLIHSAGMALVIALFWRMVSYYIYLIIGACIVPGWIRQGFRNKHNKQ